MRIFGEHSFQFPVPAFQKQGSLTKGGGLFCKSCDACLQLPDAFALLFNESLLLIWRRWAEEGVPAYDRLQQLNDRGRALEVSKVDVSRRDHQRAPSGDKDSQAS